MKPRFLLLQARTAVDPMREHEHLCFASSLGLPPENVVCHDLCAGPPPISELKRFDALTVGGAGDFYVSRGNLPHWEAFLDFLRAAVDLRHPTFASCFGYQSLVCALGGEMLHDPEHTEVGSYDLTLTPEGEKDLLLGTLPRHFTAQLGHKDRAVRHPKGIPNLASSERSPFQALRVPGTPIWATQFHPELDRETNVDRFVHYRQGYSEYMEDSEVEAIEKRFRESPETSTLLPRFLEQVLGVSPG